MNQASLPPIIPADAPDMAARAADMIRKGRLVGLPTETVYGLAGDATSSLAVARIYAAKGRPSFNPLIVHVESPDVAGMHGLFSARLEQLAQHFWPGPLTIVVPARPESPVAELARAGLGTIALRVPAHAAARAVIKAAGLPLAAPSANRSGQVTATRAAHVAHDLGAAVDLIIDAGASPAGLESTVIAEIEGKIVQLRAGALPRTAMEAVLGEAIALAGVGKDGPLAPGMLTKHYAPRARVRLGARRPQAGEAYLGFGPLAFVPEDGLVTLNLSERSDLTEAAARLFHHLRLLDDQGASAIAVAPIPATGLGEAINDRLARAALGR